MLALVALLTTLASGQPPQQTAAWRKPSAAVLVSDGTGLLVANEGTGTLSLVRTAVEDEPAVITEFAAGKSLTDLTPVGETGWLLATDAGTDEVRAFRLQGETLTAGPQLTVPDHPVSVSVSRNGEHASVASMWGRTITVIRLATSEDSIAFETPSILRLGFAPRLQLAVDDDHLLVADAFGGRLAIVDLKQAIVNELPGVPGGNIRGLALSSDGQSAVLAQSVQNSNAYTDFNDVHWGMLTQNVLRQIPIKSLLRGSIDPRDMKTRQVGQPGFGAADLAGLIPLPNGEWLVASSGAGEVVFLQSPAGVRTRVTVGARPLRIVPAPGQGRAYVLNHLSDSVSVVDTRSAVLLHTVKLGPTPDPTPASRGERLFFNSGLSHDNWLSCHSCHVDGHTTDGLVDTKSDGSFGSAKRVLSLLGTRDANPWAWNGSFRELHEQVSASITSSMQGAEPTIEQVSDIVAYLHTLSPAPPVALPATDDERVDVARGRAVFEREGCSKCHVPSLTFTTDAVFDVGFRDENGLEKFNPPSLRGVSQRSAFLHDGRARSLQSVFEDHAHQVPDGLSPTDLNALLEFLKSI